MFICERGRSFYTAGAAPSSQFETVNLVYLYKNSNNYNMGYK